MSYNWTETDGEIATLALTADALEIAGCRDLGDFTERCDGERADMFSVYFHFTPISPNDLQGAVCIADRDTLDEARALARELAERHELPVHDFARAGA
ncbi:hypothetical protein [Caenibius sp. WL]|uniref:hypothetical protein n=1 Tax=Caenibius sp. WL TaxID=2872646 RepID=UPI001C995E55|nr:hypothetical protein [Caenibius sp. WL]QZP06770.1 hypothetical protein K5X80_08520 [Caenibius sp. WL]